MFKDRYQSRQYGGNMSWLPLNTGFRTEVDRSMEWLLNELSAVLSFIPHLSSQKPFLRSSGHDLPSFRHLDWINSFMSRDLLLSSFLELLLNPVTSALFQPLCFAWFDPAWRRRRRKRARKLEENTTETLLRYNSSLPAGQVQDFVVPSYSEDESDETSAEITNSFFSSDFVRRRLPFFIISKIPPSSHQRESVIINHNLVPTIPGSDNYSDTTEMLRRVTNKRGESMPFPTSDIEGIYIEIPYKETDSLIRFTQLQLAELSQPVKDIKIPAYQKAFRNPLPILFTQPVHQIKSLLSIHWLTTRLQQWFSKNKTRPITFNATPEKIMTNSIIADSLSDKNKGDFYLYVPQISVADSTLSPVLSDISSESINVESKNDIEIASHPRSTHLPPFGFDFQQGIYPTAGELPLAIRSSFSLMHYFQENPEFSRRTPHSQKNMASNTADILAEAMSIRGDNKTSGYRQTEEMELALAPVGRPQNATGTRETASTTEPSTEGRSQAEKEQSPAPDYEALATEVYDILKRKLFIEKERAQGIR